MVNSAPSLRGPPAVFAAVGAAGLFAGFAGYLVYSALAATGTSGPGLHRSSAVRRPNSNARSRSGNTQVEQPPPEQTQQTQQLDLGNFDFFGHPIHFRNDGPEPSSTLITIARAMAPSATPAEVNARIVELYDTFFDRLIAAAVAGGHDVSTPGYRHQLCSDFPEVFSHAIAALERHGSSLEATTTEAGPLSDGGDMDLEGRTLQAALYHIAEHRASNEGVIHRGIMCNGCSTKPIRGIRWRCANCADFDLCSDCEAANSHDRTHIFYKIRIPAPYISAPKQEPMYPGDPRRMDHSIDPAIRRRMVAEGKMEGEQIDALWDQFTCLATVRWEEDPSQIKWAIDRQSFNRTFVPQYSSFISAPNLIYDRLFAYFDSDRNTLIGFDEFVDGLNGLHSQDPKIKSRIAFDGYDIDNDGLISRRDALRLFRAYYAIEQESIRNYIIEVSGSLPVRNALSIIESSRPLGAAFGSFSTPARPPPTNMGLVMKTTDQSGNMPPVLAPDTNDTMSRADFIRRDISHGQDQEDPPTRDLIEAAIVNRWDRRQFSVDEEEGLSRPEGYESDEQAEQQSNEDANSPILGYERPRGSRSSSRVRFQDDVDYETRSNASTSSRPVGERWGGFEIPEPENDLGKDVLYQTVQRGFQELLDPIFKEQEDLAMHVKSTILQCRQHKSEIREATMLFQQDFIFNSCVTHFYQYSMCVMYAISRNRKGLKQLVKNLKEVKLNRSDAEAAIDAIFKQAERDVCNEFHSGKPPQSNIPQWHAYLFRQQFRYEFRTSVLELALHSDWIRDEDSTLPQFRPNSSADERPTSPTGDFYPDESNAPNVLPRFLVTGIYAAKIREDMARDIQPGKGKEIRPGTIALDSTLGTQPVLFFVHLEGQFENVRLRLAYYPKTEYMVWEHQPLAHFCSQHGMPFDLIYSDAMSPQSPLHAFLLAYHDAENIKIKYRGGPGRVNYDEFEQAMRRRGKLDLRMLETWFDWVSF